MGTRCRGQALVSLPTTLKAGRQVPTLHSWLSGQGCVWLRWVQSNRSAAATWRTPGIVVLASGGQPRHLLPRGRHQEGLVAHRSGHVPAGLPHLLPRLDAGIRPAHLHGSFRDVLSRPSSLLPACGRPPSPPAPRASGSSRCCWPERALLPSPVEALGCGQPWTGWFLALASVTEGRSVQGLY